MLRPSGNHLADGRSSPSRENPRLSASLKDLATMHDSEINMALQLQSRGQDNAAATLPACLLAEVHTSLGILKLVLVPSRSTATPALTPREHQIAQLLAQGLANKEVAVRLGITQSTVTTLIHRAYIKLNVHSRAELALALARSYSI